MARYVDHETAQLPVIEPEAAERSTKVLAAAFAVVLMLLAWSCTPAAAAEQAPIAGHYGSKTPYVPQQDPSTYQRPPAGFVPVFVEHVARHGSRGLTSKEDDDLTLQVWEKARDENALTPLGRQFGPEVKSLMAANEKLGYGNLSGLGIQEHRRMAERVVQRLPELFRSLGAQSGRIDIVSSGKDRAVDSGRNFAEGLVAAAPAAAELIAPARVDKDLLYFHKSPVNQDYQRYLENDPRLRAVLVQLHGLDRTRQVARRLLERLYTPAFVNRLAAGEFDFVDRGKGEDHVRNEVDAALAIYSLYVIAPGMREEGKWGFERFVDVRDVQWLAYLADAEDFYEKGPGFENEDVTYRMASVLLNDFFAQIEAKVAGTSKLSAVFRFAHAEEIIPLAALMRLPGSTQPASAQRPYTYENNPWRGASVSPMGANIQWDVFRNGEQYLVRMLYNERETAFKAGCKPVSKGSFFYDFQELQRCFDRRGAAVGTE